MPYRETQLIRIPSGKYASPDGREFTDFEKYALEVGLNGAMLALVGGGGYLLSTLVDDEVAAGVESIPFDFGTAAEELAWDATTEWIEAASDEVLESESFLETAAEIFETALADILEVAEIAAIAL